MSPIETARPTGTSVLTSAFGGNSKSAQIEFFVTATGLRPAAEDARNGPCARIE